MRVENNLKKYLVYCFIVVCSIVMMPSNSFTQIEGQYHPNLTITFDAQLIDADVVYLGDLAFNLQDLVISPNSPIIFYITISADQPTDVMFGIDIVAATDVTNDEVEIFSGITVPVRLEANKPRHFSSRDFSRGGALEFFRSESIDINSPYGSAKKIIDVVRATSRLPDGEYYFYLTAFLPGSPFAPYQPINEVAQVVRILRIFNPTNAHLISPFDGAKLTSQFPFFQWRADTRDVILRVYELRDGMQSPEDAITGIPHLEQRISGVNQFLYPQSGVNVRTLEPGKRYVWFIDAVYKSSASADEAITSEYYTFSIIDPISENLKTLILNQLSFLFQEQFQEILEQIKQNNFELTGDFFMDGNSVTPEELLAIFNSIQAGINNITIQDVTIQQK